MIYAIIVLWILGTLATVKLDSVWLRQPTEIHRVIIGLIFWPIVLILMLGTPHNCSQALDDGPRYRL